VRGGIAERGVSKGRVYATVAGDATNATLHGIAKERILPESTVFTDEYYSYNGLEQQGYTHRRINHSAGVYVTGDIHTNTIEGFWGLVKRGIGGVYHQVRASTCKRTWMNTRSAITAEIRATRYSLRFWRGFLRERFNRSLQHLVKRAPCQRLHLSLDFLRGSQLTSLGGFSFVRHVLGEVYL
jgi:transposase-like protein